MSRVDEIMNVCVCAIWMSMNVYGILIKYKTTAKWR